jgi:hypothetical protein
MSKGCIDAAHRVARRRACSASSRRLRSSARSARTRDEACSRVSRCAAYAAPRLGPTTPETTMPVIAVQSATASPSEVALKQAYGRRSHEVLKSGLNRPATGPSFQGRHKLVWRHADQASAIGQHHVDFAVLRAVRHSEPPALTVLISSRYFSDEDRADAADARQALMLFPNQLRSTGKPHTREHRRHPGHDSPDWADIGQTRQRPAIRERDPRIARNAKAPPLRGFRAMGAGGFEPPTSRV